MRKTWRLTRFADGTAETQINAIASHPTMPLLVTAHEDKYIRIFDIATGGQTLAQASPGLLTQSR
jgi:hypothetical protein